MLKIIAASLGCKNSDILLIDDQFYILEEAAEAGFSVCCPLEIVELMKHLDIR